jgi:anthranilate phosphoribosyltransferase
VSRIEAALGKLLERTDLDAEEARACCEEIMAGAASEPLLGGFLIALRMKGETPEEIAAFAAAMRQGARGVPTRQTEIVDTCGTGGDGAGSFNISTAAALVAAGAGAVVAKHGNRAVSGCCGSADLLAQLGVGIECDDATVGRCLDEAGLGFLFAPAFHPAMRQAAGVRKALGVRTVFNLLGPLIHPARAPYQVVGVYESRWLEPVARALALLGTRRALVVHGFDGMDEITTTAATHVAELDRGAIRTSVLDARELGIARAAPADLAGGNPARNAAIVSAVLAGESGPRRDIVVLNAAAALLVSGVAASFPEGLSLAARSLDSGAALAKLNALRRLTAPPAAE